MKVGEARIILNMVWHILNQTEYLNGGRIVVYNDNMKLLNKINFRMVKSLEYVQKVAALISEILRIVRRSAVKFEFLYAPSYSTRISLFNENQPVYLIQQCHLIGNKERREVHVNKQKQNLDVRGNYNIRVNSNLCD